MEARSERAPDIDTPYGWLNTDRDWHIKDFKGKIVLLDFWTYGCVNCYHILPDLRKLEEMYPNELVIIGVHSGKFTSEKGTNQIRNAILKFGIKHPVVNDAKFDIWQKYGVNAWPTVVLIDPDGYVVGKYSGEGVYHAVNPYIKELLKEYGDKIDRKPLHFKLETEKKTVLRFPGKIISAGDGTYWISDSGHNRIVKIDPEGKILQVIGDGKQDSDNGAFVEASFSEPQGMALVGDLLYIADTGNNLIRVADLKKKTVTTVAGNGQLGYYWGDEKWGVSVLPNSPWGLFATQANIYVANAGNHQILRYDLKEEKLFRFAGSGREALINGKFKDAAFNQPSGITRLDGNLYVADTEASAIRELDMTNKTVKTIVGKGLFEFGDKDGPFKEALLQHVTGIFAYEGNLYVADTYNNKIKVLDMKSKNVKTLVDGLDQPNGVLVDLGSVWIANTNAHQIVKVDLETGKKKVLNIRE
ncbi:thioredoxin-like domain-containing protein [Fulvitalea axinellae]|uniref:thioredoxin-like domain-containing protein n=1 Tax=Fulvitalea axinellae TaxID=1182444 RepID=UPI0030CA4F0C